MRSHMPHLSGRVLSIGASLLALVCVGCGDRVPTREGAAAVAALRSERWDEAQAAARAAAEGGDVRFVALRYFVRGNVAYARSLERSAEAARGDPEAAKMAYQLAEDALAYWQMAAASRLDWPEARRNVERGLLRLQVLRESKTEREKPPERPLPPEDEAPADDEEQEPELSTARVETRDLPAGKVGRVLKVLVSREQRKRVLRRAQRKAGGVSVERDW